MRRVHWCKQAARAHATECRENERNVAHNADRLTPGNVVCSVDRLKELWTFRDNVLRRGWGGGAGGGGEEKIAELGTRHFEIYFLDFC